MNKLNESKKIEEIDNQSYYLSSVNESLQDFNVKDKNFLNNEEINDKHKYFPTRNEIKDESRTARIIKIILSLFRGLVYLVAYAFIQAYAVIYGLFRLAFICFMPFNFYSALAIIQYSSILYIIYIKLYVTEKLGWYYYISNDCQTLLVTYMISLAYIKLVRTRVKSFKEFIYSIFDKESLATIQFLGDKEYDKKCHFFDYRVFPNNYGTTECEVCPNFTKQFSYFSIDQQPSQLDRNYQELLQGFDDYIPPKNKLIYTSLIIIFIKLIAYFTYQERRYPGEIEYLFSLSEIYSDIIFQLFLAWDFNRINGNYDLIRKQKIMKKLSNLVDFSEENIEGEKIDITCPVSLETWDNTRKFILNFDNDYLKYLELNYISIFILNLISIVIISSFYFELDWIIPEEHKKVLQNDQIVILNTFSFFFFTFFILFRFNEGEKYNQYFEDMEQRLTTLLDTIEDLQTMYDKFFFHKNQRKQIKNECQKYKQSLNGLLIKRIKLLSKYHIKNRIIYQGKIYEKGEKTKLRMKILKTIRQSLDKVRRSIVYDKSQFTYLFLNVLPVDFQNTSLTVFLGFITALPSIAPKFIGFFKEKEE